MKNLLRLCLLFMAMQSAFSDTSLDCTDRLEYRATPEFPTSENAFHALLAGRCAINVQFDLLESGKLDNLTARASEDRCNGFEKSAMRSILQSRFKSGEKVAGCTMMVAFQYDDDAKKIVESNDR